MPFRGEKKSDGGFADSQCNLQKNHLLYMTKNQSYYQSIAMEQKAVGLKQKAKTSRERTSR